MPITPSVLAWARERAGYSLEAATETFSKIASWEQGEASPTYPQLEKLADKFKVPIAVFFFPEAPDVPPIERSFRTLGTAELERIPSRIRLLLRKARTFQMGLDELNGGRNPASRLITRDLSFKPSDDIAYIAGRVRDYLGVPLSRQFEWTDIDTVAESWRQALGDVGVYVFKDQFRDEDFSGLCLYDDEFPIIYVNNTTTKTRQIFTMFHELAHLLFHTSGVDTRDDGYIVSLPLNERRIENICNRLAAAVLVPDDAFDRELQNRAADEVGATSLAQLFGVSREFIFRKFLDRGLVSSDAYELAARKWSNQRTRGTGGNYYATKKSYLGLQYITLAFRSFYQNLISEDQLADYLDVKPKHLDSLEAYVERRAF